MKELSKEKYFNYESNDLLGVMRFDFYDGSLANQWNPRELITELNNKKQIDLKMLQKELNYIQFDLINNYSKIVELCGGTGYDKETLVYIEFEVAKYVIKLIPIKDSYSYIYTYIKEKSDESIEHS
ncbi:MAG TPA: hypothetical protein DCR69_12650 [Clostridium sp.]|nr:hypothetical protein [Clostridium sp.]